MSQPDRNRTQKDHRKSIQPRYEFKIDKEDLNEDIADITNPLDAFAQFAADEHTLSTLSDQASSDSPAVARRISFFEKMKMNDAMLSSNPPAK